MAADVSTGFAANVLSDFFSPWLNQAIEKCKEVFNMQPTVTKLQNSIMVIEDVLEDAEKRKLKEDRVYRWLRKLDDILFDARNVLDDFVIAAHSKEWTQKWIFLELSKEIDDINKRLEDVINQKKNLDLEFGKSIKTDVSKRPDKGFVTDDENLFIGREKIKQSILDEILKNDSTHVKFIPIWGMGGIGKTTLAQHIFNGIDIEDADYPESNRKWIHVGEQEFEAKRVMKEIVCSSGDMSVRTLKRDLINKFNENEGRFLIVLDDIWKMKWDAWDTFWRSLAEVRKGGAVIITTRNNTVISETRNTIPESLPLLSYDDCWKLFKKCAFAGKDTSRLPADFEKIGRKIVEKLKGLPLAVVVVSSSLRNNFDIVTWKSFLENKQLVDIESGNTIMAALRWSYDLLPLELKPCFAYCSIFPKGHRFDKEELINMWMAHDFIRFNDRNERPEDVGHAYFEKLLNASFFQRELVSESIYMMHDMIYDLAKKVSNDQYLVIDDEYRELNRKHLEGKRHFNIRFRHPPDNLDYLSKNRLLSFIGMVAKFDFPDHSRFLDNLFSTLQFTRILVLRSSENICEIPDSVSKLRHIRYLDLTDCWGLKSLPESLNQLHFLQTLKVPYHFSLPGNMGNLIHLRHLIGGRASVNTGIGKLTSLQSLSCIRVNVGENIGELKNLENLRGRLTIEGLNNIGSREEAMEFNMQAKENIRELFLLSESTNDTTKCILEYEVLNALQPPKYLKVLEISGYCISKFPLWMNKQDLPNLEELVLTRNEHWELLPPLGEFKSLRRLILKDMHLVKHVGREFYGSIDGKEFFSSLAYLELRGFYELEEWVGVEDKDSVIFPCLKKLKIYNCPRLKMVPLFQNTVTMESLTDVRIIDCHKLSKLRMEDLVSLKCLIISRCAAAAELHLPDINLEILELDDCPNLSSLCFGQKGLPSLKRLEIFDCPELKDFKSTCSDSETASFSSLEDLDIDNSHILWKLFQYNLRSLMYLFITNCDELPCSGTWEENWKKLISLRELLIYHCDNFVTLPSTIESLTTLTKLHIIQCPHFVQLPGLPPSLTDLDIVGSGTSCELASGRQGPSALTGLEVDSSHLLSKFFRYNLSSLKLLDIVGSPELCFSEMEEENWKKLRSLHKLGIYDCPNLNALPSAIKNLTSLITLEIINCPELVQLAKSDLPGSVMNVYIGLCPELEERCEREERTTGISGYSFLERATTVGATVFSKLIISCSDIITKNRE